jgi:glycosyltransferase involved in cell wall biosynthesis
MDYWANIDAVTWMAKEVLPEILRNRPNVRFYVVGARPNTEVTALEAIEGVVVTGAVDDVRPYLSHAHLALAPLRIARGIQNKVLEAMAMGKKLVATSAAVEGIPLDGVLDVKVADTITAWTSIIGDMLDNTSMPCYSHKNRGFIIHRYGWERNLKKLNLLWDNN